MNELPSRTPRPFRVLIGETETTLVKLVSDLVQSVVGIGRAVQIVVEHDAADLRKKAADTSFELIVITLNNVLHAGDGVGERVISLNRSVELLAELRRTTDIPIVALSGQWRHGIEHQLEQAGADLLFRLPFDLGEFCRLLGCRLGTMVG
ncbi:hypothetical protein GC207_13305 [bacterium]|nr:hypothetical protein [bacterium]